MTLSVTGKIFGVATLGVASLLNAGCSSGSKPTTVYDPVHRMIAADANRDGILTRFEAKKFVYDHYKKVIITPKGQPNIVEFTKESLERARADGINAMRFIPEHAKVFLAAVDEWEKELGFDAQK